MRVTRRTAIGMIGAAAAAGPAVAQTFPAGAVIRSLLKDHAPGELAGGATLFHEHMSLRDGFMVDWMRHAADTRAANRAPNAPAPAAAAARPAGQAAAPATPPGNFLADADLMAEEMSIAKSEGIACIVDGGHPDMGRDIGFLK